MITLPVLITGVGGGGHGHEIVKALRLANRYRIVGTDMDESSIGFFDVDEACTVPPASDPRYVHSLLEICRQRHIKVVFHGSEPELRILSKSRRQFEQAGVFLPLNSPEVVALGMDKAATMAFLRERGFPVPETQVVHSDREIPHEFRLPAVIKPAVGGGGSNNTYLVQEGDELEFACRALLRQGIKTLVQEYIGTPNDEYTVGVLHTLHGELIGSIAMRRYILSGLSNRIKVPNRTGRAELSPTLALSSGISQGMIDDFPEVRRGCELIAERIGSKGPVNIQCRYVSGTVYPFEINPRFSGTTHPRALMGFNEPDLLLRHHVLGESLPTPIRYKFGQVIRGLREEVIPQSVGRGPRESRPVGVKSTP